MTKLEETSPDQRSPFSRRAPVPVKLKRYVKMTFAEEYKDTPGPTPIEETLEEPPLEDEYLLADGVIDDW